MQRALVINEQMLGTDHLNTATTLHSLGLLYSDQGRYKEAKNCYQRALDIYQQVLVSSHVDIGYALEEYAFLELRRGHMLRAVQLLIPALKIVGIRKAAKDAWEYISICTRRIFYRKNPYKSQMHLLLV
jgi:tetratricopeptide (TPR) repeat protein